MEEYYCPHCGAILNDQDGFDPSVGAWRCKECGKLLMDDDIYEGETYKGVAWYCDECGALLNRQSGFSDRYNTWTCDECGHENTISEDEITDEDQSLASSIASSVGSALGSVAGDVINAGIDYLVDGVKKEFAAHAAEEERKRQKAEEQKKARAEWRRRHKKLVFVLTIIPIITILTLLTIFEFRCMIPVGLSSEDLLGENYDTVISDLENAGFIFVSAHPVDDLQIQEASSENKVTEVKIGWKDTFTPETKMPSNFPVKVTYHTIKLIPVPVSSKDAKEQPYMEMQKTFSDAGFINIKLVADYDIITGWMSAENEVERITIDGDKRFSIDEKFRPDAEVVITYHALRKDRPKDK